MSKSADRKWCWPFRHDWGRWSDFTVTRQGNAVQDRYCARCNKAEVRFL